MKTTIFKFVLSICVVSATITACKQSTSETETPEEKQQTDSISIVALNHSQSFDQASLMSLLSTEKISSDSIRLTVAYQVENFKLTEQTQHEHHMANSHDGQHIHFILNNQPYVALYQPEHSVVLPVNSEHYLLSFLSRSFHESIKTEQASELVHFKIDTEGKLEMLPNPTEIGLFYSRPKGDYKGKDTEELLLDFFIVNGDLSSDGYRVKVVINNEKEFILDEWLPYQIKGLPIGKNTIHLSLINQDGTVVSGENTSVERIFYLNE